jgi:hypothetical protein
LARRNFPFAEADGPVELSLKGAVPDWVPGPAAPEASVVRVAHLSDLHIVGERYGYRMEAGTDGPRGNRVIRSALRKLDAIHAVTVVDRVLMTGDITDAGTRAEWAEFIDLLRGCPEIRRRLFPVPGNHDVNVIDRANPGRLDLPLSIGQSLRKLRVVLALDALSGDRLQVVERGTGRLGPSLKDFLRRGRRADVLRGLAHRGTLRGRREMRRVWEAMFPLVEPPTPGTRYGVILLNSNARSHFALTNAIGVVGPSQLKALRRLLRNSANPWLVLLHHQVAEYPVTSIGLRERMVSHWSTRRIYWRLSPRTRDVLSYCVVTAIKTGSASAGTSSCAPRHPPRWWAAARIITAAASISTS